MELISGVHVVETYAVCAFLTDDRLLLVDTSVERDAKTILEYLGKLRRKPRDISTIIITHTHPDHIGGLAYLRTRTEAKVAAHELEADFISGAKPYPGPPRLSPAERPPPAPIDVRLRDKQRYEELLVIHTPGHTPGSIALLDERRSLLIAGDSLQNEAGIGPMDDQYNIDPRQHRESLKRLASYQFETLICGHGSPMVAEAGSAVAAAARRL